MVIFGRVGGAFGRGVIDGQSVAMFGPFNAHVLHTLTASASPIADGGVTLSCVRVLNRAIDFRSASGDRACNSGAALVVLSTSQAERPSLTTMRHSMKVEGTGHPILALSCPVKRRLLPACNQRLSRSPIFVTATAVGLH